jgi:hypothetical protein
MRISHNEIRFDGSGVTLTPLQQFQGLQYQASRTPLNAATARHIPWMSLPPVSRRIRRAMLETISNVIKFVTSRQLPDGRHLALEDGPMRSLFLQLMETAGVSPLLLTKMQAPAPAQQVAPQPVPANDTPAV